MAAPADLRFLVVDDFSTVRRVVRRQLADMGCERVEEAADGDGALAILKAGGIDFVVADIHMPGLNGLALLESIKADEALRRLPVLMVSADAGRETIVAAAQAGAAGYLVKPFTRATLQEKVRRILQARAAGG